MIGTYRARAALLIQCAMRLGLTRSPSQQITPLKNSMRTEFNA